ncbi:MAG: prepilin-type N-terminal cleavage/methylation domain-containing protein [bacterium]|nr:prepilin-type N-terminal cleavage/methylation domain-containing protein [bacterium]
MKRRGFTLLELLIVITIIAILAAIVVVALNPLKRFRESRDAVRAADTNQLAEAIVLSQIDAGGNHIWSIQLAASGTPYMISNATTTSGCTINCSNYVSLTTHCINLQSIEDDGYLGELPIAPSQELSRWDSVHTGYYFEKNDNNTVTVGACEYEHGGEIKSVR